MIIVNLITLHVVRSECEECGAEEVSIGAAAGLELLLAERGESKNVPCAPHSANGDRPHTLWRRVTTCLSTQKNNINNR